MCVIVHLPAKRTISKKTLKNCYENNPDGYGIMAAENDKLVITRGLGNFDDFLKEWNQVPRNIPRAIHFRWRTHGEKDLDNCHPFVVAEGIAMMHNGIIKINETEKGKSDTWHFAERDIKPLLNEYPTAFNHRLFREMVESCTAGSRLLFMDHLGNTLKTAVADWHKEQGVFFSSNGYKERQRIGVAWNYNSDDDYTGGYWDKNKKCWREWVPSYRTVQGSYEGGYYKDVYYNGQNETGRNIVTTEASDDVTGTEEKPVAEIKSDLLPYGRSEPHEDEGGYEPFDLKPPTMDQLYEMSHEDMCDWLQDHPEDATDLIRELLGIEDYQRREAVKGVDGLAV